MIANLQTNKRANKQTNKQNRQFLLKVKKSSSFVKHTLSGDEDNLYLCCCLKHGYSKPKCQNLHNVQLLFVSVQRTAQISFRIFFKTRIMVDGAKFDRHDSDSQNGC